MTSEENLEGRLSGLFQETVAAHHAAYLETDGVDPDWPLWYANYLFEPLKRILNTDLTRSELVYLLVKVDKEHRLNAPEAEWTRYYAGFFIKQFK